MALQLGAVREALVEAGASAEKAGKAAEELAGYDSKFTSIELQLADLRGSVRVLQWGQGVTFAGVLAILLKLFIH